MRENLTSDTAVPSAQFSAILFDAFSSQATPELWSDEFLKPWLAQVAARPCLFTTYAAKGSLKRLLQDMGWSVEMIQGFAQKKHSTWALRL